MLSHESIIGIRLLFREGYSQRYIAKVLSLNRKTVRKYSQKTEFPTDKLKNEFKILSPFFYELDKLIADSPAFSAIDVFQKIKIQGYQGSLSTVKKYMALNIGRLLTENRKQIGNKILKADLYRCMVKGKSYLNYLKQNSNNLFCKKKELTVLERESIIQSGKSGDYKKWKFGVVIDMIAKGFSIRSISKIMDISKNTVKNYQKKYNVSGIKKTKQKRDSCRKEKQKRIKQKRIMEIIHHPPKFYNVNRSRWTKVCLSSVYRATYGEDISETTVGRYLKDAGYSLKKARRVLTSSDPNYHEKIELLLNTLHSLKSSEALFFIDEVGPMKIKKYGGKVYTKRGGVNYVSANQISKGSVSFSASLNGITNQLAWVYSNSKDTNSMIDLIEILFNQYFFKEKIYITWDAASWHSSNELTGWLDKFNKNTLEYTHGPTIELIPLPSCSQFLNIIESIFSSMKQAVIHNSNYQSEIEMKKAISDYFSERNEYFIENPKRAGKKIWDVNFFLDYNNIKSGNYREW